jgi:transcriptional regulator with XRE-family HTH domain
MQEATSKKKAIATRLALARKQAGLSQLQVAKILGLNRPSISEMEAGRRNVLAEELAILAEAYGVSISWLACEDTDKVDTHRDQLVLAARKLANLKKQDLEKVVDFLLSLPREGK